MCGNRAHLLEIGGCLKRSIDGAHDQRPGLPWFTELPEPRDPLPGDRDADVCIVGAGYTGLWTAYYLKQADPSLRIVLLEARFAGFGASGRNGGWLSGLAPGIARCWLKITAAPRWRSGSRRSTASPPPNLVGQTLADLVLRRDTALVRMPWVGHRSKTWEPEPLRWLGVRGTYQAYKVADRHEAGGRGSTSPVAVIADVIARRP
ncbi:hypothetical protein BH09ACT8_BH09ACT8_11450 [soil metagenome]